MAITRNAEANWQGDLQTGTGSLKVGSGAFEGPYSFKSRFGDEVATNPEELIAAAHAGCYTMALSLGLQQKNLIAKNIHTTAKVKLEQQGPAFTITEIELATEASVDGLDDATFQQIALDTKMNCPVSKALAGPKINLTAKLV